METLYYNTTTLFVIIFIAHHFLYDHKTLQNNLHVQAECKHDTNFANLSRGNEAALDNSQLYCAIGTDQI